MKTAVAESHNTCCGPHLVNFAVVNERLPTRDLLLQHAKLALALLTGHLLSVLPRHDVTTAVFVAAVPAGLMGQILRRRPRLFCGGPPEARRPRK